MTNTKIQEFRSMTWLSRLLPRSTNRQRPDGHIHRTRQAQRRRMATLETLEGRTLLSNVTTSFFFGQPNPNLPALSGGARGLEITTDGLGDAFSVTENASGTVTVTGVGHTTVNSLFNLPYTTTQAISAIYINIPSLAQANLYTNNISLTGHGTVVNTLVYEPGNSATNPSNGLNFTANAVKNTGFLSILDGTPGTFVGGTLTANVLGSQLTALTIDQVGCCPAAVTLNSDDVTGAVTVTEGTANADTISGTGDTFGHTLFSQFVDLNPNDADGHDDAVTLTSSQVIDLGVTQLGTGGQVNNSNGSTSGSPQTITLTNVEDSLLGYGIKASQQFAGGYAAIAIESITVFGHGEASNPGTGPPSITTLQGSGGDNSTVIDNAVVYGNISATQGDGTHDSVGIHADTVGYAGAPTTDGNLTVSQGEGDHDSVVVDNVGPEGTIPASIFYSVTVTQLDGSNDTASVASSNISAGNTTSPGNLSVSQGEGNSDHIEIDNDVVGGNVYATQLDGNNDSVHVAAVTLGYTLPVGPYIQDYFGLLEIEQGNGVRIASQSTATAWRVRVRTLSTTW